MDTISTKRIKIRKPRRCFGCFEMLNKGDEAHCQTNTECGEIYTITVCLPCMSYVNELGIEEYTEGDLCERLET